MIYSEYHFDTDLVPGGCDYATLAPESDASSAPFLYLLHGGGGGRQFLRTMQPLIESVIDDGLLPPVVAVTPSAHMSYYMDYHDGSERWETLLTEVLPSQVVADRGRMLITGISMGGVGTLRLAFRNPQQFIACASLEPGVDPFLRLEDKPDWYDVVGAPRLGKKFGDPIDSEFWAAHNPANIAAKEPMRLSALKIYVEVGTHDSLYNHHNTEFLHRVLFDNGVKHEYRMELGADHIGNSVPGRFRDALWFLGRTLQPEKDDPPASKMRKAIAKLFHDKGVKPPN